MAAVYATCSTPGAVLIVSGVNSQSVCNPDGTAISGSGGGTSNVAITGPLGVQTAADSVAVLETGAANALVTQKTCATDGTATLAARAGRRAVVLTTEPGSETVWFGFTTGVSNTTGQTLPAGSSISIPYTGAIFFYGAAGTGIVDCLEVWD